MIKKILLPTLSLLCLLGTLSSCGLYGSYQRPTDLPIAEAIRDSIAEDATEGLGALDWRDFFTDPQLVALIDTALVRNADLQKAELNVEKASARLLAAGLSLAPDLGFAPSLSRTYVEQRGWTDQNEYALPLRSSWEIDLSGRLTNNLRSARAAKFQAEAYRQLTQTNLIASVATAYYTLVMLEKQLATADSTSLLWAENVRTMTLLKQAGRVTDAAVAQAEAQAFQVRATMADLKDQIYSVENSLSLLLHQSPRHIPIRDAKEIRFAYPDTLSVGLPVNLLSNRPDIRAAELALAAAHYDTNAARGAFLPGITLTATGSWVNKLGEVIVDPMRFVANVAGSLFQPILNKGRNIAGLRVAKATRQQALLSYQQSILAAGAEVSNALYRYRTQSSVVQERARQITALRRAVSSSQQLMHLSNVSYLEVITAQQQLLAAQLSGAADEFKKTQALINLYKALGGGRE